MNEEKALTEKIRELTKEEIKRMLIVSATKDIYSAKCFAFLLLEYKDNTMLKNQENERLEKFIELLSRGKKEEAIELMQSIFL